MINATIIGAGNIGKGLLGLELYRAGWDVSFVDTAKPVLHALKQDRGYVVKYVDERERTFIPIKEAVHLADKDGLSSVVKQADIILTAVGCANLPIVAEKLWRPLVAARSKTVIACENTRDNSSLLENHIKSYLARQELDGIYFRNCIVDRIAVTELGTLRVERKFEWVIQSPCIDLGIKCVEYTPRLGFYADRKFLMFNGSHAILGYLAYGASKSPQSAMHNSNIRPIVVGAVNEVAQAISAKYEFSRSSKEELIDTYAKNAIKRFENTWDTAERLAKDPIRKLRERLVPALLLAQRYNLPTNCLEQGIAAALRYNNPKDSESRALQKALRTGSVEDVLQSHCGPKNNTAGAEAGQRIDACFKGVQEYFQVQPR
ncbi:hypothetical protein HY642_01715 [Candidatus Woesearchaeota archaeon]|nr:hypothetical protein [Candidatus Woesearchaeota archaeon]